MMQGKIERYLHSIKHLIFLDHYYSPSERKDQISISADYWYHYALNNVTLVDMYYGRASEILDRREQIKRKTMLLGRKQNRILRLGEKTGKVYRNVEILS
jgi:putative transposase